MTKKNNSQSFEKDLVRLEEISTLLDNENIGLEEAIALYEEGINLSRSCINSLKNAELKITELKRRMNDIDRNNGDLFEE